MSFVSLGGNLLGSFTTLNATGLLGFQLSYWGQNEIYLDHGTLMANTTSVPEPGTLSLLGAGLLAGWLGKRRRKVAG